MLVKEILDFPLADSFFSLYMVLSARPCRLGLLRVHSSDGINEVVLMDNYSVHGYVWHVQMKVSVRNPVVGVYLCLFFSQLGSSRDKGCVP